MWPLGNQISEISTKLNCTTGHGQLDCLRKKSGADLQAVLLATGNQFQPVTDNITIWKECVSSYFLSFSAYLLISASYVAQTKGGHTARVPLLIGTNKVQALFFI